MIFVANELSAASPASNSMTPAASRGAAKRGGTFEASARTTIVLPGLSPVVG